ncbi:UDP-N-acetylmuramoyl-L-alanine--D-glutamate ligase [Patescibacteria group bacterium]|nr:MAG: UDP-N-acetylmuramoyl-L-alanine--D-glutamate ligase [Patescibacteria group bacterium]
MKIAIAGYGLEGEENYKYWAAQNEHDITIVDESLTPSHALPEGVPTILGPGSFEKLQGFDLVIRTAGLAPYKIKTDGKIWSATNEFFEKCPAKIIGVTGTKGKGTTASMIAAIFEAAGRKVHLVGNIGVSAIEALAEIGSEDIVVYELSSFQLWDLERSPHAAVVLFIEPEHLNVHTSMEDYVNAKGHIRMHQTADDIFVYHPTNRYAHQIAELTTAGKTIRYGISDDGGVYERDGLFLQDAAIICPTNALQVIGAHNIDNACAAITLVRAYDKTVTVDQIEKGLRAFTGLPHRLKFVREVAGVRYYDDSIATTPGSAIAALRSFDQPKVIILGGSSKGSDFSTLAQELLQHDVKKAILIGDEAPTIANALDTVGFKNYEILDKPDMTKIVTRAHELATPGSVVLLSPSSASFGLFKDYADRGNQFIAVVEKL